MSAPLNKQRRVAQLNPLTVDEIEKLPPARWLVDRYLPENALVVVCGPPGEGKTFAALDWMLCIATGEPWLGHKTRHGEVVYIYAEGTSGLRKRYKAWCEPRGLNSAPRFRAIPSAVNMLDGDDRGCLATAIKEAGLTPQVIVIDTLARNFGAGDENMTKDMNAFVAGCAMLREEYFPGATVLVIHHTGKNVKRGARGAIALTCAADVEFLVTMLRKGAIKLENRKQKDTELLPVLNLRLVPVGENCVIRAADDLAQATKDEAAETDATKGKETEDAVYFALLSLDREGACYTGWLDASGKPKATFERYRKKLIEAGRVVRNGDLYCCDINHQGEAKGLGGGISEGGYL